MAEPESEPESEAEPEAGPEPEPEPVAEPVAEPEAVAEAEAEPVAEPESVAEPEPVAESVAEADFSSTGGTSSCVWLVPRNETQAHTSLRTRVPRPPCLSAFPEERAQRRGPLARSSADLHSSLAAPPAPAPLALSARGRRRGGLHAQPRARSLHPPRASACGPA